MTDARRLSPLTRAPPVREFFDKPFNSLSMKRGADAEMVRMGAMESIAVQACHSDGKRVAEEPGVGVGDPSWPSRVVGATDGSPGPRTQEAMS